MPDIESPTTYGEYYAAGQLEVAKIFAETEEKSLKPFIPSIFSDPGIRDAMPFDIYQSWINYSSLNMPAWVLSADGLFRRLPIKPLRWL